MSALNSKNKSHEKSHGLDDKDHKNIDHKSKNDSKQCILEIAANLFSKLGFDRTSTRDIAKESQANISLISYHFGGKEGLYKEVIREFALKVQSQVSPMILEPHNHKITKESFSLELERIVDYILEMRRSHPEISKILSREKIEGMPLSREIHEEIFYPMAKQFFQLFTEAQKQNIIKPQFNPAVFFIMLTEGIWGFHAIADCKTSVLNDCKDFVRDSNLLKKQITDMLLTGVLT